MSTPGTPSNSKPAGDDRNLVAVDSNYAAPSFEDRVHKFWEKNRGAIFVLLGAVILVALAKGAWEYVADQREQDVEQAYASAKTSEQLKSFVAEHPQHSLAGVAQLRIADEAYAAGKSTDAIAAYEQSVAILKTGPLASRAKLGLAMAKFGAGRSTDAEAALKALAADTKEEKPLRAEAAYQLVNIASAANRPDEVKQYAEQVMAIDPTGSWAQRAMALRARLPVSAAPTAPSLNVTPVPGK
jgi:tetratricopeptide (TPR) repeat protein